MNAQFQICALVILLLLLVFYKSHKTLNLYKEKVFYLVMCIIMASLFLDVISCLMIYYKQYFPMALVSAVCKLYIVSLLWGAWSALIYVITDLLAEQKHKECMRKLALLTVAQSIAVCVLPIYVHLDETSLFTYGTAVLCVYVFVALYILATLVVTSTFRKKLNPRRRFAINLWMIIWIVCAVIQFFNTSLLIVGFASAIGVLILFVLMENPEANLDRRLGCFNSYALTEYLKQRLAKSEDFGVLEVSLKDPGALERDGVDAYDILNQILLPMKQYPDSIVFKNIQFGLMIISDSQEQLESVGKDILACFSESDFFHKAATLIWGMGMGQLSDEEDLFRFLSFIRSRYSVENGKLFRITSEMITKYQEHFTIEQEIADALAEDRVEVFLQPIYANQNQAFTSAEALVRIRKRDGSLLSPGIFIPIAESTRQILELGERVFEKVCQFLTQSEAVELGIHYIEVNLSVIQCEQKDLAKKMIEVVEKYGVNPEWINLEITETGSISARKVLLENMKVLIDYGFSFSLDDFGKGESNLMYVVDMPVSIVKLDYDMSKAFFRSAKAKHVVKAVVGMAHGMDLKLVAEGIETEEEMDGIFGEGIDYIQGYYYSKPLPMKEFVQFLKDNN